MTPDDRRAELERRADHPVNTTKRNVGFILVTISGVCATYVEASWIGSAWFAAVLVANLVGRAAVLEAHVRWRDTVARGLRAGRAARARAGEGRKEEPRA